VPVVALTLSLVLYAGSRTVTRDMERLRQWMERNATS
jgi:hypothetical protein